MMGPPPEILQMMEMMMADPFDDPFFEDDFFEDDEPEDPFDVIRELEEAKRAR